MSITINTNLGMSNSFYALLLKLRKKYGCSKISTDKSSTTNATKGTTQAAKEEAAKETSQTQQTDKTNEVSNLKLKENLDYEELIKELKLNLPENKFSLLMMLPVDELFKILEFLEKDDLLNGLKFFTKERLMSLVGRLPKEDLLKMLFKSFTAKEQLIQEFPKEELFRFLHSDKISQKHFINVFKTMPKEQLSIIAGYLTKTDCGNKSQKDLLELIKPFKKNRIIDSLHKLDQKVMYGFITTMVKMDENLYNEFSHNALFNVTGEFAKTDIIKSMSVIDNSKIMDMLAELPQNLIALTASQIDPEIFSKVLLSDHKDLLASLVLG